MIRKIIITSNRASEKREFFQTAYLLYKRETQTQNKTQIQTSLILPSFRTYRLVFKAKAFLTDNKVLSASDTLSFLYFASL